MHLPHPMIFFGYFLGSKCLCTPESFFFRNLNECKRLLFEVETSSLFPIALKNDG